MNEQNNPDRLPDPLPNDEDDDEDFGEAVVCRRCDGDGCSQCDYEGMYYPDMVEPVGDN
jgi:hypothetical protein